jgi:hypothetical protein
MQRMQQMHKNLNMLQIFKAQQVTAQKQEFCDQIIGRQCLQQQT